MIRAAVLPALALAAGLMAALPPAPAPEGAAAAWPAPLPAMPAAPQDQGARPGLQRQQAAIALARPLFKPGRNPPAAGAAPPAAEASPPRLSGTVLAPAGKAAIFAAQGDGRPAVRQEGSRIGGFEVVLIEAGRVTVIGPAGPKVLYPAAAADAGRADAGRGAAGLALPARSAAGLDAPPHLLEAAQAMR